MELLIQAMNSGLIDRWSVEQIRDGKTTRLTIEKFGVVYCATWSERDIFRKDIDYLKAMIYNDVSKLLQRIRNEHYEHSRISQSGD